MARVINGCIIYQGPSQLDGSPIVAIATGIKRRSANRKTGDMVQIWILRSDMHPVDAMKEENNSVAAICGDCPLIRTVCYVNVAQAPRAVYRAFKDGGYRARKDGDFTGRKVRFGAYGDPTAVPFEILRSIADECDGWTGYTHQWRRPFAQAYASILMASVESESGRQLAHGLGWRAFVVYPVGESLPVGRGTNAIHCPSDKTNSKVTCAECGKCDGKRGKSRLDIYIPAHGAKAGNLKASA